MTTLLAELETRLAVQLMDGLQRLYPSANLDEGIRNALDAYSNRFGTAFTIQGLDGAESTSLPEPHEELILCGAAGFAVQARAIQAAGAFNQVARLPGDLAAWSERQIAAFQSMLNDVFEQDRIKDLHTSVNPPWDSENFWNIEDETGSLNF